MYYLVAIRILFVYFCNQIHNILPIGKIIQKYDAVKYTSTCPSCPHMCKDGHHFLQCPWPHRCTWWSEIKKQLRNQPRTTDPQLMEVLMQFMRHWLVGSNTSLMTYSPQTQTLIKSQISIAYYDRIFFNIPEK
jgi:hypothetical protein